MTGTWTVELLAYSAYEPVASGTMTLDDTEDSVVGSWTIDDEDYSITDECA
ncbi:MAG: hypothetical protein IH600_15640 [Bacteroidetes bacterium]|nr:hypothetical protein [Bacteroidota bacterium]